MSLDGDFDSFRNTMGTKHVYLSYTYTYINIHTYTTGLTVNELLHARLEETLQIGMSQSHLNYYAASSSGDRFLLEAAKDELNIHVWMEMLLAVKVLLSSLAKRFLGFLFK